jgi:phosphoglycerol transferase MdoB-like AlkP superfamily enzyme
LLVEKQTKSPFFAIIQTSGNHRPYTIPEKNYGFKLLNIAEEEVKKYGFESLEELNSFRFMDHSIGLFIQQAKKEGSMVTRGLNDGKKR